ncbi:endoplasmic oxidoreductin [Cristinia sonorae]|uniref:Endoplasmic oxidoreductin n=1 Tax=Cristinia sonorae TaxID=1940300 RepID=A0A8K0V1K5_9AGAR|nr:endoplasmic oxidoreductin [Cristinia sonorae]
MLPQQIYAILAAFLLQSPLVTADSSFLANTVLRKDQVQNVLEHQPVKQPVCKQIPTGPIETTLCDFETVEAHNDDLYTHLKDLVKTPFFKYFRVDLYRDCPFWQENGFCMNRECGITTTDESEIPERWRAAALSKVEMPSKDQRHKLPGCYYRDSDFCFLDDMSEGDYIDLSANPERFTGYAGPSARRVWASIYEENCFGMSEFNLMSSNSPNPAPVSLPDTMTGALRPDGVDNPKACLEKRVYYKIISGLHASISTHVCYEDMNQSTGEWGPNLQCFINRVAAYPERLQYIYFNVVLLLRAISRIGPYLSAYDYCGSGAHEDDVFTLDKLNKVIDIAQTVGKFDETVLFRGENATVLKDEFKAHFRNVSRIMDCVGCDKCRLWGKVQTSGLGTALKILFELDEKALNPQLNANLLSRSEVVALINTLHRFSESLAAVNIFRKMWSESDEEEARRMINEARKVVEGTTTSSKTRSTASPLADSDTFSSSQTFVDDLQRWVRACQEGTVFCLRGLVQGVRSLLATVSSLFKLSGKEGPPRSEF